MFRHVRRWAALAIVVAVLATPGFAWAGASARAGAAGATPSLLQLFERVWSAISGLVGEAGCSLDPDGCAPAIAPPPASDQSETGCSLDPDGCSK